MNKDQLKFVVVLVLLFGFGVFMITVVEPYARRHPAPGAPSAPVVEEKKPERLQRVEKDAGGDWTVTNYVYKDRETGTEIACFTYNGHISCVVLLNWHR